jgi:hypothetical protein
VVCTHRLQHQGACLVLLPVSTASLQVCSMVFSSAAQHQGARSGAVMPDTVHQQRRHMHTAHTA